MKFTLREKHLLWILMERYINQYLIACTSGRENGTMKSYLHIELVTIAVSAIELCPLDAVEVGDEETLFGRLHTKTQKLTDYMDEVIGFPLNSIPDYDDMSKKFFAEFIRLVEFA